MTLMPSEYFKGEGGIDLDDAHLAWIGAITSYFAFGEQQIEMMISFFSKTDREIYEEFCKERTINFERKTDIAKKIFRKLFQAGSDELCIGTALMARGKILSKSRKHAAHWMAQSGSGSLRFADMGGSLFGPDVTGMDEKIYSDEEVFIIARDIRIWAMDVMRYTFLVLISGSLNINVSGNISEGMDLTWDKFGSIKPDNRKSEKI